MAKKAIFLILFWPIIFSGIDFDGTDDLVSVSSAISNFITVNNGTISCWVKLAGSAPTETSSYNGDGLVADLGGYIGLYRANISSQDRIWAYNYDGSEDRAGATYSTGVWIHFVWRHSGSTIYIFKDGTEAASTASGATTVLTNNISIGKGYASDGFHEGQITEIAVWNVGLTDAEIALLAKARKKRLPLQIQPSNLKGYWPMDETSDGASADGVTFQNLAGGTNGSGDDGSNNTGLTAKAEEVLSY